MSDKELRTRMKRMTDIAKFEDFIQVGPGWGWLGLAGAGWGSRVAWGPGAGARLPPARLLLGCARRRRRRRRRRRETARARP